MFLFMNVGQRSPKYSRLTCQVVNLVHIQELTCIDALQYIYIYNGLRSFRPVGLCQLNKRQQTKTIERTLLCPRWGLRTCASLFFTVRTRLEMHIRIVAKRPATVPEARSLRTGSWFPGTSEHIRTHCLSDWSAAEESSLPRNLLRNSKQLKICLCFLLRSA